jgi:hypothetical protein
MTDNEKFVIDFLKLIAKCDGGLLEDFHVFFDKKGELIFTHVCSDVFHWGWADSEGITKDNLHLLEEAFEELPLNKKYYAPTLFCCKVRKMRPQGAWFSENIEKNIKKLFNKCGPKRKIDVDNPYDQNGKYQKEKYLYKAEKHKHQEEP